MVNYYDILEIHHEVSTEEIKQSFQKLIKKYHPDTNRTNKLWAESKTRSIIQAYKILSDSEARKQYDRLHKHHFRNRAHSSCHGRKAESAEPESIQRQFRSLLLDLLEGNLRNAIRKYEHLLEEYNGENFLLHLNYRDYFDCKFLLAESYEKIGDYEAAVKHYEVLFDRVKDSSYRRHLTEEIKERIRNIYCRNLAKRVPPEKALIYYEKVLNLNLYKHKNAFIYKKMAECFLKLKKYENALKYLNLALSLKPNLKGINRLKAQLKQYVTHFAA